MCQNKIIQTETSSLKHHGVHFVSTAACGRAIPLMNTAFPFPNKYQLQMPSWFAVGLCVHFLFLVPDFFLVCACVGLVHAASVSVSSCYQSYCVTQPSSENLLAEKGN